MVTKDKQWWTSDQIPTSSISHLPCPLPPNQSVIWLVLYHCVTVSPCHCMRFPYHCITISPHHCMRFPYHHVTTSLHHRVSRSFALPPATKPVSHLPCPLPPNQSVIWHALYHCVTVSPHEIFLPLCHHITMSLHEISLPLHHCITTSPHHRMRFSPPYWHESDWLMLPSTVLIG